MVDKVKSGTTGGLGKIQMDGFDPNNIIQILQTVLTLVLHPKQKQPPILKEVVAVSNSTTADTNPVYIFSS